MEGKPSLIIDGNPLLIKNTFKKTAYCRKKPLTIFQKNHFLYNKIPDYGRITFPYMAAGL
jgi:hypothetical protein